MAIAVMGAMPEEVAALRAHMAGAERTIAGGREYLRGSLFGRDAVVVYARMGKVAAAATAAHLIGAMGVREIIFTGVAGGVDPGLGIGDVVVARDLYQHDLDASPIFPPLEIPLLGVRAIRADEGLSRRLLAAATGYLENELAREVGRGVLESLGIARPRAVAGDIASGDRFFASSEEVEGLRRRVPTAACVEMEGAAVAQVCHEYGTPFAVVRTISDGGDESAAVDFNRFVLEVASQYSLGIVRALLMGRK